MRPADDARQHARTWPHRSGRSPDWINVKNPDAPARALILNSKSGFALVTLGVKVGGRLSVDGHELKVLRINSDGSIDYAVR